MGRLRFKKETLKVKIRGARNVIFFCIFYLLTLKLDNMFGGTHLTK